MGVLQWHKDLGICVFALLAVEKKSWWSRVLADACSSKNSTSSTASHRAKQAKTQRNKNPCGFATLR